MPSEDLPQVLWHYTTASTLMRILKSGEVHATALNHLNDSAEVGHALTAIEAMCHERLRALDSEQTRDIWREMLDRWLLIARTALRQDPDPQRYHHFREPNLDATVGMFCLSRKGDSLAQWRGYGGASGVAIGFSTAALQQIPDAHLMKCYYAYQDHHRILTPLVDGLFNELRANGLTDFVGFGREEFLRIAPMIKAKAFEEEEEWRLVTTPSPPSAYTVKAHGSRLSLFKPIRAVARQTRRATGDGIARWNGHITMIQVGPSRNQFLTFDALHTALLDSGIVVQPYSGTFRGSS